MKIPCFLIVILLSPLLVNAYSWRFTSPPRQCENVTLSIQGSGGQPPYSLLIIPTGPSPLPVEVRLAQNIPFSGTSTTLSFNLKYPANSTFVAVVSDKNGFGTGGASTYVTVRQSPDSSCYSTSKAANVAWWFYFDPSGGLTQCDPVRLWWYAPLVNGTVSFYGAIPGGTAFTIPQGSLSSNNVTGTGFNWTTDIAGGADVLLVGNDDGGIAAGGHVKYTIASSVNNSCLDNNSPSSTAGNPAGGAYSTSTSVSSSNGSGSHSNTGAILGGVLGAAILLVSALAFWFIRRRSYSAVARPVNVLQVQDDEDQNEEPEDYGLPQYYVLEPYPVSDQTTTGTSPASSNGRLRSMSTVTADVKRPQTPTTPTKKTRKSAALPQLPPVNIIQHDDAGPSEGLSGQVEPASEMIELPPAYSKIHQLRRSLFGHRE